MEELKKLFQATDMTVGEPWKQIVRFTAPMLIGNIAQQLYNTVDAVIVGRFVGKQALASVGGSAAVLSNLIIGFFTGLSAGATVIISQHYGAKTQEISTKASTRPMRFPSWQVWPLPLWAGFSLPGF